jgi:GNAT superfamily N-acetyltransferase
MERNCKMITILPADPADAPFLKQLEVASKASWGYAAEWIAQWERILVLDEAFIRRHIVFVAWEDNVRLGFYSLEDRGGIAWLEDLWVTPARIGTGLGRQLFMHAVAQVRALGKTWLEWEAEPNAVPFYLHMGAKTTGTATSEMGRELPIMRLAI